MLAGVQGPLEQAMGKVTDYSPSPVLKVGSIVFLQMVSLLEREAQAGEMAQLHQYLQFRYKYLSSIPRTNPFERKQGEMKLEK